MIPAIIVQGHRVASGLNGNPLFPSGTMRMQRPFFKELGLDLYRFHPGTLNVSIAPLCYHVVRPKHTFRALKWHPTEHAEDFSFFDVAVYRVGMPPVEGFIYHPHPDTKPKHFQNSDVLELLLPWTEGLAYGTEIALEAPPDQIAFHTGG